VSEAVQKATQRFENIDILVNNAGYGYRAAIEEGTDDDVQLLFATNFFGPVAMIRPSCPACAPFVPAPS
jgi:NAD(P)-dependent dehydrogenase (short-subunit alcohol dehydrogenase family)